MEINRLTMLCNQRMAGELLRTDEWMPYWDEVVHDINNELNSKFPTVTAFILDTTNLLGTNYNFIPDKYMETVFVYGACTKYYDMDEEGIGPAQKFEQKYMEHKFMMLRDFVENIPEEFQADDAGFRDSDPDMERGLFVKGGLRSIGY